LTYGVFGIIEINGYDIMRRKKIHSCVHEQFTCGKNGIELKVLIITQQLTNRYSSNCLGVHQDKGG
jgi:hypothetical protein